MTQEGVLEPARGNAGNARRYHRGPKGQRTGCSTRFQRVRLKKRAAAKARRRTAAAAPGALSTTVSVGADDQ